MVPLIFLGMGAARLVAPHIAKALLKRGVAKAAPKGTEAAGKSISKINELPPAVMKAFRTKPTTKTPPPTAAKKAQRAMASERSRKAAASRKNRMETQGRTKQEQARIDETAARKAATQARKARTQETREQVAAAKQKRKTEFKSKNPQRTKLPAERKVSIDKQSKELSGIAGESAKKLKDATQMQGKVTKVPAGQKGMRLPAKGETVKRKKGGKVVKNNTSGQDLVNSCYD